MRALEYFKGATSQFEVADALQNVNLRRIEPAKDPVEGEPRPQPKHQILVASLYNKVIMFHANPGMGKIFVYELDPSNCTKYSVAIGVPSCANLQLQVVDNLLVVHNMDEKTSQLYDLKNTDYS